MPDPKAPPRPAAGSGLSLPKIQFSLARLMVVMTLVAILLGFAVTVGGLIPLLLLSLIWCVVPTPLVICAIFGRGDIRAFAIGGLVPWLILWQSTLFQSGLIVPVLLTVMSVICGIVAVATFRWVTSQS